MDLKQNQGFVFALNMACGGLSGAIVLVFSDYFSFTRRIGAMSRETAASFWQRNFANVRRFMPTHALTFAFYDLFTNLKLLEYDGLQQRGQGLAHFASGGLAGAGSLTITYPFTLLGQRSMRQLYKGYGLSLFNVVPYRAVSFGLYHTATEMNTSFCSDISGASMTTQVLSRFVIAYASVAIASLLVAPVLTVQRRLRMQAEKPLDQQLYRGSMDCMRRVWKEEGLNKLYNGSLTAARRSGGSAALLVLYGLMQKLLTP